MQTADGGVLRNPEDMQSNN